MMNKKLENKLVGYQVETAVSHNSAISAADCEPLVGEILPVNVDNISNTSQLRMGDKVQPKSLRVKGILSFKPDTANTQQPIYARIVIASQKTIKVGSQVLAGTVDTDRLLRPGFAGDDQVGFTGATEELSYPLNKDLFHVYMDKVVKLNTGLATAITAESPYPNYCTRWSYSFKKLPASLSFDEGNGNWANNFAPFVAIGYAFCDGTSPDVLTTRLISHVTSFLEFEDA